MRKKLLFPSLLATIVSVSNLTAVFAQGPTDPLSLAEAIAWGVDNSLSIAGQRLNVEVAARNDNWVTAGRAPIVQATIGVNNNLNAQDNPASFINGTFYTGNATAGIQASYTLFNGYRVRFTKQQLGQQLRVANQQVKQLVETSVFDVAQAYYAAQLEEARTRNAARKLDITRDQVAYQQVRREYGQGTGIDLLQAKSAYFTDSLAVERAYLSVANANRALYLALDATEDTFEERPIADTLVFEPKDWEIAEIARRIDSSAAIQLLRSQEQLALTQTELARTALKPSVDLTAGLNHTRTAFKLNGEDPRTNLPAELIFGSTGQGAFGVQAAYTLFDAGARKRTIENAIVQERISYLATSNARRDANTQARTFLETYRTQRELLALQDALIANAKANLRLAEEQLRSATINSFNYREVQLAYFDAVQARIDAVYNILITDLNLRRLTGELVQ